MKKSPAMRGFFLVELYAGIELEAKAASFFETQ